MDVQEAIAAAQQLLADIEAQICSSLGVGSLDVLELAAADPQQLQQVPAALLESLEATVAVIQGLREQAQQQSAAAATSPTPSSPSPSSSTSAARRHHHHGGRSSSVRTSKQQHPQPLNSSTSTSSADATTAARSSLFKKAASERAVAQWQQHKLQQQQEAARSLDTQLVAEEEALQQLQTNEAAAGIQHSQVTQRTQQLAASVSLLQLLASQEQRWHDYLRAAAGAAAPC